VRDERGQAITMGGIELIPVERVAEGRWRGGTLIWRRPIAVDVRQAGTVRRIRIYDATRLAVAAIIAAEVAVGLALWGAARRRRETAAWAR
jgi:hypothetical protein